MPLETPLWIQNGRFPSYSDRTLIEALVRPGVIGHLDPIALAVDGGGGNNTLGGVPRIPDLGVTLTSSTPPQVTVAPGRCVIAGTDQLHQGSYVCRMTDPLLIDLDARPASGSRRDLVYAQVVDTSAGITGTDGWVIDKLTGDAAPANPVLPTLPGSAIHLADVLVPAGTAAIVVTDARIRARSNLAEAYGQQAAARFPPGNQDIVGAGVAVSGGRITARLAGGTHLLHCRMQGPVVTAVPTYINAYVEGPGFWSGGTQYVCTEALGGTYVGAWWAFHSTHIIAIAQPGADCTYTMKAGRGGSGAWRLAANSCHMIIERIL
jgi:hypothetical protein